MEHARQGRPLGINQSDLGPEGRPCVYHRREYSCTIIIVYTVHQSVAQAACTLPVSVWCAV